MLSSAPVFLLLAVLQGSNSNMHNIYGCNRGHNLWPPKFGCDCVTSLEKPPWSCDFGKRPWWLSDLGKNPRWLCDFSVVYGATRWPTPIFAIYGVTKPGCSRKYCAYMSDHPLFWHGVVHVRLPVSCRVVAIGYSGVVRVRLSVSSGNELGRSLVSSKHSLEAILEISGHEHWWFLYHLESYMWKRGPWSWHQLGYCLSHPPPIACCWATVKVWRWRWMWEESSQPSHSLGGEDTPTDRQTHTQKERQTHRKTDIDNFTRLKTCCQWGLTLHHHFSSFFPLPIRHEQHSLSHTPHPICGVAMETRETTFAFLW